MIAEVAELAYAQRLGRCPARVVGSSPTFGTKKRRKIRLKILAFLIITPSAVKTFMNLTQLFIGKMSVNLCR
jgi:hypothetical protein